MNREDIIRMAQEAGAMFDHMTWVERDLAPVFERFAALVAEEVRGQTIESEKRGWLHAIDKAIASEREACACMAEAFHQHGYDFTGDLELHDAIRARGQI
jgi:hypothetical protein